MMFANRSSRSRSRNCIRRVQPALSVLEDRALLTAGGHKVLHELVVAPKPHAEVHRNASPPSGPTLTPIQTVHAGGYTFYNFDLPGGGTNAGAGTNINGIANNGTVVGFAIDGTGAFHNYAVNPLKTHKVQSLNTGSSTTAMALGVNSGGTVVGTDGNGNAFTLNRGNLLTFIPPGGTSATAFGVNDQGTVVGQYATANGTPGFLLLNNQSIISLNAPSGPNVVNAQGINNKGLVVGFYQGTDGQVHGFTAQERSARFGSLTGTAVADPTIPTVAGEPGATFVFSQILGVNDRGLAVGYYGDSTTSQHGYFYNTNTGKYTFLDDPSEAFNNGVEVTQITGITNSGEISGFYSDANGVFHGFVAVPTHH